MTKNDKLPTSNRPIGFWIKAADQALDQAGDAAHAVDGFTRRRWQVLSLIVQRESITLAGLVAELAPMMESDAVNAEVGSLKKGKFIDEIGSVLGMTEAGEKMHRRLAARQAEIRQQAMARIEQDDYTAAIRCLSRITENLSRQ